MSPTNKEIYTLIANYFFIRFSNYIRRPGIHCQIIGMQRKRHKNGALRLQISGNTPYMYDREIGTTDKKQLANKNRIVVTKEPQWCLTLSWVTKVVLMSNRPKKDGGRVNGTWSDTLRDKLLSYALILVSLTYQMRDISFSEDNLIFLSSYRVSQILTADSP